MTAWADTPSAIPDARHSQRAEGARPWAPTPSGYVIIDNCGAFYRSRIGTAVAERGLMATRSIVRRFGIGLIALALAASSGGCKRLFGKRSDPGEDSAEAAKRKAFVEQAHAEATVKAEAVLA